MSPQTFYTPTDRGFEARIAERTHELEDVNRKLAELATKAGVEGDGFRIQAPLQNLSKAQIVQAGVNLGVDYALTVSCYQADDNGAACGKCDSCRLRAEGFKAAGISDPTNYF